MITLKGLKMVETLRSDAGAELSGYVAVERHALRCTHRFGPSQSKGENREQRELAIKEDRNNKMDRILGGSDPSDFASLE